MTRSPVACCSASCPQKSNCRSVRTRTSKSGESSKLRHLRSSRIMHFLSFEFLFSSRDKKDCTSAAVRIAVARNSLSHEIASRHKKRALRIVVRIRVRLEFESHSNSLQSIKSRAEFTCKQTNCIDEHLLLDRLAAHRPASGRRSLPLWADLARKLRQSQ